MKESEQVHEIETLARDLAGTFLQRRDLYPRQLGDGSYVCVHKPLLERHLVAHLDGRLTLGAYVLSPDSRARFVVVDVDDDLRLARLVAMSACLAGEGVPSYLETSRRGGHLWFFFEQAVAGEDARAFGLGLLAAHGLPGVELYPKQARLGDGPGSLIRLPFGIHRKTGRRYGFVTPSGVPLAGSLAEQIRLLSRPCRVPQAALRRYATVERAVPQPVLTRSRAAGETLSEQIKSTVTVYDFVRRYVALSPAGRGRCPFHDDRHASFSVNVEKNYWHCFAGCGGGSLIDFWMKWRNVDFREAVGELAGMLL